MALRLEMVTTSPGYRPLGRYFPSAGRAHCKYARQTRTIFNLHKCISNDVCSIQNQCPHTGCWARARTKASPVCNAIAVVQFEIRSKTRNRNRNRLPFFPPPSYTQCYSVQLCASAGASCPFPSQRNEGAHPIARSPPNDERKEEIRIIRIKIDVNVTNIQTLM